MLLVSFDFRLDSVTSPGLGPMYSCTLYLCTRVHILEYSDVLYTHDMMYAVLVLEYIHKVLVLSEYILSTFS